MEPSWSTFLFQQANEALHHQHQVAQNSLLPLLNSGAEPIDQKPILPLQMDQKPPLSASELLKDGGGGGRHGPMPVVKKEQRSKTPFICGYCNKAFRDSYHLRRHESCHTGIKMVSRPKKSAHEAAPTMVPMVSSMGGMIRETMGGNPYISTMAGLLTSSAATASVSSGSSSSVMSPSSMGNMSHHAHAHAHAHSHSHGNSNSAKKPSKPVKKNHGCEMCGKAFRDVYHLNRHKLSHSDEKPFECPICHQRFKRKDRMTYHARSHDGGVHKPYVCSVCGKGFSRPDHLSCHVKHVHSSERPFKCQVTACTSAFATKDRLRSHMIRHEGKVTCNICGKMLSAAYITSHLKTHGQAGFTSCNKATAVSVSAPITTAMNRGNNNHPVTIAAQMNISTNTVSLHHPVTMVTGPVNIASVHIPGGMNLGHPVAITAPMPMNIAMRSMESMPFLSQVLPSSPPW